MDKYTKALEQARNYYPDNLFLDTIFPELAESEDERIRKALLEMFNGMHSATFPLRGISREQYIAWLEKQKEQKPAEWSEEDEKMLEWAIACCKKTVGQHPQLAAKWLESLRPQPHWKPGEEQPEVDLEKEIDAFFDKWDKNSNGCIFDENGAPVTIKTIKGVVKHFLNARKGE